LAETLNTPTPLPLHARLRDVTTSDAREAEK
jgi:hypothetical protein